MLTLMACGGGGGSSSGGASTAVTIPVVSSSSSSSVTPAPTVNLVASSPIIKIGQTGTVAISTTNADSCSEKTIGNVTTNGSANYSPTASGHATFSVTCTGTGGSKTAAITISTPYPVLPSSYENKNAAYGERFNFTELYAIQDKILRKIPGRYTEHFAVTGMQWVDLRQDGNLQLVIGTYVGYNPGIINENVNPISGAIKVLTKTNGVWADVTADFLDTDSGCMAPRKLVVADFNNDSIPDIFVSCHGYDGPETTAPEFREGIQHIILSNKSSKFSNVSLGSIGRLYAHGASAADINNDGNIDLVVADAHSSTSAVQIFLGDGKGQFSNDTQQRINPVKGGIYNYNQYWSIELFRNKDKSLSMLVAGTELNSLTTDGSPSLMFNSQDGYFLSSPTVLPAIGHRLTTVLDAIKQDNKLYVLTTENSYQGVTIESIDLTTNTNSILFTQTSGILSASDPNSNWLPWMQILNGHIVSYIDSQYDGTINIAL